MLDRPRLGYTEWNYMTEPPASSQIIDAFKSDEVSPVGESASPTGSKLQAQIRPGSLNEIDNIVDVHLEAYRGMDSFGQKLGRQFLSATYRWFLESPKGFSLVAVVNNRVVGFVVGSYGEPGNSFRSVRKSAAAKALLRRPWIIFQVSIVSSVIGRICARIARRGKDWSVLRGKEQSLHIYSIAVAPEYTELKIGRALQREAATIAREHGSVGIYTSVGTQNTRSIWFHRAIGFKIEDQLSGPLESYLYKSLED